MNTETALKYMVEGYCEAVLFAGVLVESEDGDLDISEDLRSDYMSPYTSAFTADCLKSITEDCSNFLSSHYSDIAFELKHATEHDVFIKAGADFYFTRNGHGTGFWDGWWEYGDELTEAAEIYGEEYYVLNDDHQVECL